MATHRLYYDDSYLQNFEAHILACEPGATISGPSGPIPSWEIILDQTAFYPSSGGQPHDIGLLGVANVLDVRDDSDDIVHIVDHELASGPVKGCVQWPRRFDHMQQHTGQHLLSAMFQERFGLPTVSFHLGAELCTIDLRGPEPSSEVLQGAQRASNQAIFENRLVTVRYGTADQLAQLGVRKDVDRHGILRAIEIESADLQPCGGTHVKSLGQIGMVLVRRVTKVRQDWRVEFACGARAERFATADFQCLRDAAESLTCAPDEIRPAIGKALAERDAHFKSLRTALQQLAEARAALLVSSAPTRPDGMRIIAEVLHDTSADLLLPLATEISKAGATIALLAHEDTGQIAFAQHPSAAKDMPALLKQIFEKYPGKGGGTRDFVRAKLTSPNDSHSAITQAATLL